MDLQLRNEKDCRFDEVSMGEVMLRLDPGDNRVRCAREFRAWEGGGEYNVARGLRRCFGMRTGVVTALAQNDVGYLIEDFILQGGVDTSFINWVPYDGIGRKVRNGINFTERGFGVRGALGISDRANTAASQMKPGDVDWDELFGKQGVRWFHCGGIFAALSETTAETVIEEPVETEAPAEETPAAEGEDSLAEGKASAALARAKKALKDQEDAYLRLAAEYDNFRRRTTKEKSEAYTNAKADAALKFLPVYDNLERALNQGTEDEAFLKGVEMTMTQLLDVLASLDIKPIAAVGQPFDPNLHNAVMHIEDENFGENTVAACFQTGFMMGEKVIRFAMVQVAN